MDTIETQDLVKELRHRINKRTINVLNSATLQDRKRFVATLFSEVDVDGSGLIDRDEFRRLLRGLQLTYR